MDLRRSNPRANGAGWSALARGWIAVLVVASAASAQRPAPDPDLPPLPEGFDVSTPTRRPFPRDDLRLLLTQDPVAAPDVGPATGSSTASGGNFTQPSIAQGGGAEPTTVETQALKTKQPEPTFLIKFLRLDQSPVKVFGWIQNSYTGNTNGTPRNGDNLGVYPNHLANRWQGNQYYLAFENPIESDRFNVGYRFDFLFGNDWAFSKDYGLFDRAFNPRQFAGIDLPQMYLESHLPILTRGGVDIKVGRWYNPGGFENVQAIKRPLLSVPYTFNFTPFTFLGMLSTIHVTDRFNVYAGTTNGWDRWFDQRYKMGVMGGYALTSRDSNTSLNTIFNIGPDQLPRFPPANSPFLPTGIVAVPSQAGLPNTQYAQDPRLYFSTVLTHNWNSKFTEVLQSDQIYDRNTPGFGPNGTRRSTEWFSLAHWMLHSLDGRDLSESRLTGVWRIESFWDPQGAATGIADHYYESTLGLIAKPKSWLWIRPEARYDWAADGTPFSDQTRRSQLTLAFDVIVLF